VGLEDLEHALEIGGLLELGAAGAEGGTGGVAEAADGLLRLGREVDEILAEEAEDAIQRTVDFLDGGMIQGFGDDAGDAGVDDGRGAAGLADETVTYEFFCHDVLWLKLLKKRKEGSKKATLRTLAN
jgi:hypothetical protein